jgi:Transmembrane family 220, helix
MKYMNAGMILLFVLAAALQYTDADPMIWIAVYGISALLCLLYAIGKFPMVAGSVFAACCLIASLALFWKFLTTDPVFRDEFLHGAAGLFMVFLWISSLAWSKQRDHSALT